MPRVLTILIFLSALISCTSKQAGTRAFSLPIFDTGLPAQPVMKFASPVVVEAFFKLNSLDKSDSSAAFIEQNRQMYYDITDSYSYYSEVVRKRLDKLNIPLKEITKPEGTLSFSAKTMVYNISLQRYRNSSGVFLFNGVDPPVFWGGWNNINGPFHDSLRTFFRR